MQLYWQCEECDEANPYPDVKVCETCGAPMSAAAERRVLQEQKEEERRQEQIRLEAERKRKEQERARQEAARKAKAAREAAERAERERQRRAELERQMKLKAQKEAKFGATYRKTSRFLTGAIRIAAVIAVILSVLLLIGNYVSVNAQAPVEDISKRIHSVYLAHTVPAADGSEGRSFPMVTKIGTRLYDAGTQVLGNVGEQFEYIKGTYTPWDHTVELYEDMIEFLSRGAEK